MNDMVPLQPQFDLAPVQTVEQAQERYKQFVKFVSSILKAGTDYGKIPGTQKDTLLKPGAEKLQKFFGLSYRLTVTEEVKDWTGDQHGGEPFFYFSYRCAVYRGDWLVAESDGNCSSWESKYRYRKMERTCPQCHQTTIIKGKEDYGGGWLCFKKIGGCGAKFGDGNMDIEGQETGLKPNDKIFDLVNTIEKMAIKRAYVSAVIAATAGGDFFTADMEDMTPSTGQPAAKPARGDDHYPDDAPPDEPPQHDPVALWQAFVTKRPDIDTVNSAISELKELPTLLLQDHCWEVVHKYAISRGWEFSKELKGFKVAQEVANETIPAQ